MTPINTNLYISILTPLSPELGTPLRYLGPPGLPYYTVPFDRKMENDLND